MPGYLSPDLVVVRLAVFLGPGLRPLRRGLGAGESVRVRGSVPIAPLVVPPLFLCPFVSGIDCSSDVSIAYARARAVPVDALRAKMNRAARSRVDRHCGSAKPRLPTRLPSSSRCTAIRSMKIRLRQPRHSAFGVRVRFTPRHIARSSSSHFGPYFRSRPSGVWQRPCTGMMRERFRLRRSSASAGADA
jgi:hypothetical protein